MCSLTDTTRRPYSPAAPLRTVYPACRHGNGSKTVNIWIFDKHGLVNDMATSGQVEGDLRDFLNRMAKQSGLEPAAATQLAQFTFEVTYANSSPTDTQMDNFGMNDFPIYLLTATPPKQSTDADIVALLEKHMIPETIFVVTRVDSSQVSRNTNSRQVVQADWTGRPDVLGFGFPGPYFLQQKQNICRKLGIIKMLGEMIEHVQPSDLRPKLISVLKHELGHMFGNDHAPKTIMDEHYKESINHLDYSNDQLVITGRALEILRQN